MHSRTPDRRPTFRVRLALSMVLAGTVGLFGLLAASPVGTAAGAAKPTGVTGSLFHRVYRDVAARGELDCNGFSPVQKPARLFNCTDIRGLLDESNENTWGGRFYDNGHYIGHDEPDTTFLSDAPGSGDDVTWNLTLGRDPSAAPTATDPGHDVSHWFELTPAPWLSMAICDPDSYPELPCAPESDSNAPSGRYPGAGSAFMEMQFYPPGEPPWVDSSGCDDTHWCAALTIDSLECTYGFAQCNGDCEEPVNFAFIQRNGVPPGPPSPQESDLSSSIPDAETLLMNPGDKVAVRISDAPVPGERRQEALKVAIDDLTTGQSGFMQASAKNGFQDTAITDCSGTPFNFQPEYSTASVGNYIPWAALQTDISTEFETGHFEPCTSLSDELNPNPLDPDDTGGPGGIGPSYNECSGPYETAGGAEGPETGDAMCYYAGDVHTGYDGVPTDTSPPDELTGCQADYYQNGDLDFDGTPYWKEWPTSAKPTSLFPGSFVESLPTTNGAQYQRFFFQTDIALSELNSNCTDTHQSGCTVPPHGPGGFYPYWSEADDHGTCVLEFGNVSSGVDDFGQDAEYGTVQWATLGYPEFEGGIFDNACPAVPSEGYLLAGSSGKVASGGDEPAMPAVHAPPAPVVGIAATPNGDGYFAVTDTGDVFTAGDATFHGDLSTLSPPVRMTDIVGIEATADGGGYWLVGADGGVFGFGNAKFHGSLPGRGLRLHDVVGMAALDSGKGYLLAEADGTVVPFGSARSYGAAPADDIRGIQLAPSGTGYLLVGADGDAYVLGHGLSLHGTLPAEGIKVSDIVGIALSPDAGGYWMAGADGTVYPFGDARGLAAHLNPSDLPISSIAGATVSSAVP